MTASRARRLELLVLLGILLLAAATRLPGLADRGRWDADQGTDMRVLRAMVEDRAVPLLGPRTSIGTFHHGAVYYYLLAPAALVSDADPVAVTGAIALFGIAAVAGTWWLGRLAAGPLAAAIAGLLAAISPAGIDESTFIWNPNLIPAAAALAFAATVRARRSASARWWALAGVGAMVAMQCHVLGAVIVLPLGWAWTADLVRRRRAGEPVTGLLRGGLLAMVILAAGYVPVLVHELGNDFAETRGILAYITGGGGAAAAGVVDRVLIVGLRSITWPVVGLLTDRLVISMVAALLVVLLAAVAVLSRRRAGDATGELAAGRGGEPGPGVARWLLGTLVVSVVALAIGAPSLAVIVPELPNDHYHSFLDPVVLVLIGVGLARLAMLPAARTAGGVVAGAAAVTLAAFAVTAWPPAQAPDGGWPLADDAAARVIATTGDDRFLLDGIPPFKNDNAMRFPLERRGAPVLPALLDGEPLGIAHAVDAPVVVLVCDPLFDEVVGAPCGGAAEDAWMADAGRTDLSVVERFEAGPRRVISIYAGDAP